MTTEEIYRPIPYFGYRYSDGRPMLTTTRDLQALELMRVGLGYAQPMTMLQGCYHDGSLSAGTHSGSSVFDLLENDFARKAEIGARHGVIVFHRPFNWDGKQGGAHLHCIVRGGQKISDAAHAQVGDWDKHLDGLAYHRQYDTGPAFPWFPVKPFVYHAPHDPPPPPHEPPPTGDRFPVLDASRIAIYRAMVELDAVIATHPRWQFGKDIRADLAARWHQIRDIQTPQ